MSSNKLENIALLPRGAAEKAIHSVIRSLGIENYTTKITNATLCGDNFMGSVFRIQVIFKNIPENPSFTFTINGDSTYAMSLILKAAIRNSGMREIFPLRESFVREIYIYENVLIAFEDFQIRKGINLKTEGFSHYAKIFAPCLKEHDEFFILDDKSPDGFVIKRRQDQLDYNHCLAVIKQLAKYHALSFIMQKEDTQFFDRLKKPLPTHLWVKDVWADQYLETFTKIMKKVKSSLDPKTDKDVLDAYDAAAEVTLTSWRNIVAGSHGEEYLVISHGDCWINNIMFKYRDAKHEEIDDICFLDFAAACVVSPIFELANFLYINAQNDVIKYKANDLIEKYYESLSNFMCCLGHDSEELFPKVEFDKRLPEYFMVGIYWTTFLSKIVFQNENEAISMDQENTAISMADILTNFMGVTVNEQLVKKKIETIMKHAYVNGFFDVKKYCYQQMKSI